MPHGSLRVLCATLLPVQEESSDAFVDLLLLAARALGPVIRRFISLGLNRVWLKAGDTAYKCASPLSPNGKLLYANPECACNARALLKHHRPLVMLSLHRRCEGPPLKSRCPGSQVMEYWIGIHALIIIKIIHMAAP